MSESEQVKIRERLLAQALQGEIPTHVAVIYMKTSREVSSRCRRYRTIQGSQ